MVQKYIQEYVDEPLITTKPSTIIGGTVLSIATLYLINKIIKEGPSQLKNKFLKSAITILSEVPGAKGKVEEEKNKIKQKLKDAFKSIDVVPNITALPEEGIKKEDLIKTLEEIKNQEGKMYESGKISGTVYMNNQEHEEVILKAYELFMHSNPLHPDTFPAAKKFESEIVRMTATLLNGDEKVCGAVTSGGTESILMSLKAYRDRARALNPSIDVPEIIAPISAHAAFDKGCNYFGMKLVHVEINQKTFQVDPKEVERRINKNTILIVGSAPHYPQGIIDPIKQLSALAIKYKLGLHVDCCLGGYVLPFAKELGFEIEDFDFSLEGVSSISADTHKYGLAPKGSSVVLFKDRDLRSFMYFLCPKWTGGIYASPTMPGSRPGTSLATCWASLLHIGKNGYKETTKNILECVQYIKKRIINEFPELQVCGDPQAMIIALESKKLNTHVLSDSMKKKHWELNCLQNPTSIHFCVTSANCFAGEKFIEDLRECIDDIINHPENHKGGMAPIYGMNVSAPDALISDLVGGYIDCILDN